MTLGVVGCWPGLKGSQPAHLLGFRVAGGGGGAPVGSEEPEATVHLEPWVHEDITVPVGPPGTIWGLPREPPHSSDQRSEGQSREEGHVSTYGHI